MTYFPNSAWKISCPSNLAWLELYTCSGIQPQSGVNQNHPAQRQIVSTLTEVHVSSKIATSWIIEVRYPGKSELILTLGVWAEHHRMQPHPHIPARVSLTVCHCMHPQFARLRLAKLRLYMLIRSLTMTLAGVPQLHGYCVYEVHENKSTMHLKISRYFNNTYHRGSLYYYTLSLKQAPLNFHN